MTWLNKLNDGFSDKLSLALSALVLASAALTGCNVGKSDTVATTGSSTSGTTTTTGTGKGCTGSYVGGANPPSHEVRIATRDRALIAKGIDISQMTEAQKNAATGGGGIDGGMYLEGSFAFETDANCNVIKGNFVIFGYPFPISGTVNQDRTFTLSYLGPIVGRVNADNTITGELQHGGGEEYIHGDLWGTFTAGGHI
ncbi:MAG: hypothetical protein ABIO88_14870 [Burkholderiaceae bacterium]